MDNCEVYQGLSDLVSLFQVAFNDTAGRDWYNTYASYTLNGIQTVLWDSAHNNYLTDAAAPADELESVVSRCHSATVPGAVWSSRPHKHPSEESLQHFQYRMAELDKPEVPRRLSVVVVSGAAALMSDTTRVNNYITTIQAKVCEHRLSLSLVRGRCSLSELFSGIPQCVSLPGSHPDSGPCSKSNADLLQKIVRRGAARQKIQQSRFHFLPHTVTSNTTEVCVNSSGFELNSTFTFPLRMESSIR